MDGLVTSSKTLAITVIAFYFGLHKATPHRRPTLVARAAADPDPPSRTSSTRRDDNYEAS
jgi:hypothetical protein